MIAKRFLAIAGLLLLLQAPVWAIDLTEGFSGIAWGTDIVETQNLIRVGSNADVEYYINPGVVHTIDDVNISQVIYGFYAQRLFAAYAYVEDLGAFNRMKEQLQAKYGIPKVVYSELGRPSIYRWKSGKIKIKLKVDSSESKMKAAFYYIPLSGRVNEDHEENFRENKIKFLPIERDKTPKRLPLLEF
jgi:hypothetical protein